MKKGLYTTGLYCYAIALIGLGMVHLVSGQFTKALFPAMKSSSPAVYTTGALFLVTGIGILIRKWAKQAAMVAALVFFALLLYPHLPYFIGDLYDPNEWTMFFQLVACCAGALLIMGSMASRTAWMMAAGRYAFAISMAIFGIQHFLYADFIQTLIPGWIPGRFLWSWLIRIAFIFTAMSIALDIVTRFTGILAGLMFLLWIILFHIPRVAVDTSVKAEWTSLFIALVMTSVCFLLAGLPERETAVLKDVQPNTT